MKNISAVSENIRNTNLLIMLFFVCVTLLGYLLGRFIGIGSGGIIFAFSISLVSTLISFYMGESITLKMNHAKPLPETRYPEIIATIKSISQKSGISTPKAYLIEDKSMNAFATGRDPNHASIALTSGIIDNLSKPELEGVISHELAHIKNYDIRLNMVTAVLLGTIVMLANYSLQSFMWRDRDNERNNNVPIIILGIFLAIISPIIGQLIQLAISRQREYLADATGAGTIGDPNGLAGALEKIGRQSIPMINANQATAHLYITNPFGKQGAAKYFSTHPPIADRINRLREIKYG